MCKHSLCPYRACAWSWHSQQRNHCSLSKSWKGRKKRKGRRGGDVIPGWEQPPGPALVPVFGKEQQRGKGAEVPARSPPSHFCIHPPQGSCGSSTALQMDKAFPKPSPAPWTTANHSFPGAEPSGQPGRSSRCSICLDISGSHGSGTRLEPSPRRAPPAQQGFSNRSSVQAQGGREGARILTTPALMKHPGPGERQ